MDHLNLSQKKYNIYRSLATFQGEGLPKFSPDLTKRRQEVDTWNQELKNKIHTFDILLDFDAQDHEDIPEVKKEVGPIKKQLDKHKIPYTLWFSGCGFHITLPHHILPQLPLNPDQQNNIYQWSAKFLKSLQQLYAPSLDISVIDHRRLQKIPYSLALYGEDEEYVCLPLTDKQFNNFFLADMRPYNVLRDVKLYKRGLLQREGDKDTFKPWAEKLISTALQMNILRG